MSQPAQESGISRKELGIALAENPDPSFGSILKGLQTLGMKLTPAMA
jgi:DNA-binding phage protein